MADNKRLKAIEKQVRQLHKLFDLIKRQNSERRCVGIDTRSSGIFFSLPHIELLQGKYSENTQPMLPLFFKDGKPMEKNRRG
jgi:hypothetical protein